MLLYYYMLCFKTTKVFVNCYDSLFLTTKQINEKLLGCLQIY